MEAQEHILRVNLQNLEAKITVKRLIIQLSEKVRIPAHQFKLVD